MKSRAKSRASGDCIPTPTKACCVRCPPNSTPVCAGRSEVSPPTWKNWIRSSPTPSSSARSKRCWPIDFDDELDRLYREHVAPPSRARRHPGKHACLDSGAPARRLPPPSRLSKLERNIRIEGFTEPGDPLRLDYGYRNGVRGFIHSISLRRDSPGQGAGVHRRAIHARDPRAQITAITEIEPAADNPRHQFVEKLFAEQNIRIVAMNRVEGFAEELRLQLN